MAASLLVTTPIFYVNSRPHLGHAFSMILADATARWKRQVTGLPVNLSTGTDEHGQKVSKLSLQDDEPFTLLDLVCGTK